MPTVSDVAIANMALTGLGDRRITAFTDESETARAVNGVYSLMREEVLSSYPWGFALVRVAAVKITAAPLYGWDCQFQIPTDSLRVVGTDLDEQEEKWVREGDRILTNATALNILYVKKVTDPTQFTAAIVSALAARLTVELAYTLTQDLNLGLQFYKLYLEKLRIAKGLDAQEGRAGKQMQSDAWLNARSTGQI